MKTRLGFVSNSSSSSFLIMGVTNQNFIKDIASKLGLFYDGEYIDYNDSYGVVEGEFLNLYGSCEPSYIGIDISDKIKVTSFNDLKKEFQDNVKNNYNVEIPLEYIDMHFGEVGDG